MRFRWLGDQATKRLQAKLFGNVDAAGAQLEAAIVEAISTPGPPRSLPGEAPHIDTDRLHGTGWSHETDAIDAIIVSRVSTDVPYAVDLEEGTPGMAPRPFIRSTLIDEADALARTMCKP